eukprot:14831_6
MWGGRWVARPCRRELAYWGSACVALRSALTAFTGHARATTTAARCLMSVRKANGIIYTTPGPQSCSTRRMTSACIIPRSTLNQGASVLGSHARRMASGVRRANSWKAVLATPLMHVAAVGGVLLPIRLTKA